VAGYYQKSLRDRLLRLVRPGRDAVRIAQQFTASCASRQGRRENSPAVHCWEPAVASRESPGRDD